MDGRADQYSLGCVLFESLTGIVPFRRDSELAVLWAHVNDPPPRIGDHRPDLPVALDDVIGRALAKAPGDRHPSCGALVATAQAALAGTAPAGVRHRVRRAVGRRARPRPPPALASGLTRRSSLVLAIVAGLLWPWSWWRPSSWRGTTAPPRRRPPGGDAGGQPGGPHRRGDLRAGRCRRGRDRPVGGDRRRRVRLGRQPAGRRRDRGRPRHQPGPGDPPGVRVRAGRPGRPRPRLHQREPLGGQHDQREVVRVDLDTDPTAVSGGASPVASPPPGRRVGGGPDSERRRPAGPHRRAHQPGRRPPVRLRHPPTGLAVTRDGRTVWVATAADKAIRRIDTRAGRVVERIELPARPRPGGVRRRRRLGDQQRGRRGHAGRRGQRRGPGRSRWATGPPGSRSARTGCGWRTARTARSPSIDPETHDVGTLHLGFRPAAVAVVEGAVWVALAA